MPLNVGCAESCWTKREMVPSDLISQPSSPPACHGTELRSQNCLGEFPSAPRDFLSKATVHCFRAHLPAILAGTGVSQRPFAHPQQLPVSGLPFRGRSSRPATSTPYRHAYQTRSISGSPLRPGSPRCTWDRSRQPVAWLSSGTPSRSSDLRSPLGPFGPLRIKAFNPIPYREVHLPDSSDRSSLPDTSSISSPDTRSTLQTR